MEYIPILLKAIAAFVPLVAAMLGILNFRFSRRSAMIAEYNHAKSFLKDCNGLHPYAKDLGYYTIAGTSHVDSSEIEYVLSLQNPVKALKCYVAGRKYFVPFQELKYPKIQFRQKYVSSFKRAFLLNFYKVLYFVFAFIAMSPLIFSQLINVDWLFSNFALVAFSSIAFVFFAIWMLYLHVGLYFAEWLYDSQETHADLKKVKA
ncbi:hypothetical protein [Vibrio harveyi]|nr:hypothetical protein [Vibrio harveyi]